MVRVTLPSFEIREVWEREVGEVDKTERQSSLLFELENHRADGIRRILQFIDATALDIIQYHEMNAKWISTQLLILRY